MAFDLQGALQGYNAGGAAADLGRDLQTLAPGVTTIGTAPNQGANFNTASYKTASAANTGALAKFTGFLGNIGRETGHLAVQAADWLGHTALTMVEAPIQLGSGIGHGLLDHMELGSISQQQQQLSTQMQTLQANYKAGKINKQQYTNGLKDISQSYSSLEGENRALNNRINFDQKASTQALVNTASDLVTILTAGFGKAMTTDVNISGAKLTLDPVVGKAATDWLASKAAEPLLGSVQQTISRVASQPEVLKALDATTQEILQRSAAEVVANVGDSMTAGQIARATAVNVAFKYPMMYSYLSSTGNEIYKEFDQAKYGDALRTLAFNALLLLSGGPIGHALKYGGDAVKGLSSKTFGQASFWDELSKFYGDKSPAGFANAIRDYAANLSETEHGEFIRNMGSVEATNIAAVGGDAKAAAYRVAKGMQGQYAFDLGKVTHAQAVEDMVNFASSFRDISSMADRLKLGPVAIGRLDARDKNAIAEAVSGGPDVQSRLNAWERWKAANPNAAAANNTNFDTQIKGLITKHADDPGALVADIAAIKARSTVEGFPQQFLDKYAKQGYIPIKPRNLEAPFKEGSNKLTTAYTGKGDEADFFTKAVKPLPVLGSVGSLLTHMGLSPDASTSQTYQLFNDSLARRLAKTFGSDGKVTPNELSLADDTIKKLSNFANETKIPVKDLRMLTVRQISKALGSSLSDAKRIQNAITQAHLDVPLTVKGLGDQAVDWSYRLPGTAPVMRQYLKLQGALRFSFNPFFQYLRVIPKTEMLTQAEGGGYINAIFQGRAGQIGEVRQTLHDGGFLNEAGRLGGGDEGGIESLSANIHKKLLPAQERSIAGLVDAQAQRMGLDTQEYMRTYPGQVRDTVQAIAEYDRRGNFINSPLARTLNIAFFPFRFDTKVAQIFARNLGQSSLVTQVSVINGLMKGHDFLTSPQGQAWYAQNKDVLGLIGYITPLTKMSEVVSSLLPGHDHSLGNFGELGGLPFGWIPQLLDSEGLTHFNQPGMDPASGKMFPTYIPTTSKGQLATAIADLVGMMYSYPGAVLGLPSKGAANRTIGNGATGATTTKDFKKITPQPNAQQQVYSQDIQSQQPKNAPAVTFSTGNPSNPITFGMRNLSPAPPRYNTKNGKPKAKRLKESQYPVELMPGQTRAGQL